MRRLLALFCAVALVCMSLCACADDRAPTREPLTIVTDGRDYTEFEKEFGKVYPEIGLRFVDGGAGDKTQRGEELFDTDTPADIYMLTALPDASYQKKYLIDLSGYAFSERYAPSRLSECSTDGSVYLLPCGYAVLGIFYNRTLFEKYGWEAPGSFAELEELVPKIRAAGVGVSTTALDSFESAFHYLFDLGDTTFLRTPAGLDWAEDFLDGDVSADDAWAGTIDYMQKWIDLDIINGDLLGKSAMEAASHFSEGNTAFFITDAPFRFSQKEDGSGDRYGLLPWLSPDGSNNRYVNDTSCYYALSTELEKASNRQKLEDALKLMDFVSTENGERLLSGEDAKLFSPLSGAEPGQNADRRQIVKMLNDGFGAPTVGTEWENVIDPIGEECAWWYAGETTGEHLIEVMNRAIRNSLSGGGRANTVLLRHG